MSVSRRSRTTRGFIRWVSKQNAAEPRMAHRPFHTISDIHRHMIQQSRTLRRATTWRIWGGRSADFQRNDRRRGLLDWTHSRRMTRARSGGSQQTHSPFHIGAPRTQKSPRAFLGLASTSTASVYFDSSPLYFLLSLSSHPLRRLSFTLPTNN